MRSYLKYWLAAVMTLNMALLMAQPQRKVQLPGAGNVQLRLENDSLKKQLNKVVSDQRRLEQSLAHLAAQQRTDDQSFYRFKQNNTRSTGLSRIGTIILLIGSFFEIVGAILLAGADLSNKMEPIKSVRLDYTAGDLAIHDVVKDKVMTFLSACGSVSILIGFCLQFTGTIVVLGFSWYLTLAIAAVAICVGVLLFLFLAAQTLGQPLKEKARIFWHNINAVFLYPVKQRLSGNKYIVCEVCQRRMPYAQAQIWYKQGQNSDDYPYLHPPYGFYVGHAECLSMIYPLSEKQVSWMDDLDKHTVYKEQAAEFYENKIGPMTAWNNTRISELKRKRNSDKEIDDETTVTLDHLRLLLGTKSK